MIAVAERRRGACPSLSAPMQTGDGLLVRLNPMDGLISAVQLAAAAREASRFGNGMIEITARGSLQIRGLTEASAPMLADAVDRLGIDVRTGVPVETGPLAGLDPLEVADPRPMAEAIRVGIDRAGLVARLGPKVSVVVDGGGRSMLDAVKADVRLTARREGSRVAWALSLAGDATGANPVEVCAEDNACSAALEHLAAIAAMGPTARARDLPKRGGHGSQPAFERVDSSFPVGETMTLNDRRVALRLALAFGTIDGASLAAFATVLADMGIAELRLGPERSLLVICASAAVAGGVRDVAARHGMIVRSTDPRLSVVACAGAPACASAHYATRALAERIVTIAPEVLDGTWRLHLSGCVKRCAEPAGASVAVIGHEDGCALVANGTSVSAALREYLAAIGTIRSGHRRAS